MCRAIAYLGDPVPVHRLLFETESSLVRQVVAARMLPMLNLAGSGFAAWHPSLPDSRWPILYKSTTLPIYDRNLMRLSHKVDATCLLAHVRGTDYIGRTGYSAPTDTLVGEANLHPFHFEGVPVAMAHNGYLSHFADMKYELLPHIDRAIAQRIEGTTDSEWIFAILASHLSRASGSLDAGEVASAVEQTLWTIGDVRRRAGIETSSPMNLFLAAGDFLVVTRFTLDFGCWTESVGEFDLRQLSLWYTLGRDYGLHDGEWKMRGEISDATSVLVASEPLTRDTSTWVEAPEYSISTFRRSGGRLVVHTSDLDV
ncbi:MAG TPA: class II glutamine amidotransferase [Egibacteraceae bacterium]|nr:class II glutamine amidotransferase [Egibacteraceae bacterium]